MYKWHLQKNKGQAVFIAVMFFLAISLVLVSGISAPVLRDIKSVRTALLSKDSFFLSEGGLEDAVYRIKRGIPIDFDETIQYGEGSVYTVISDLSVDDKVISSQGNVNSFIRNTEIELATSVGVDFFYGSQAGDGGIVMEENSTVQGAGGLPGNIYSNGPVIGSNGASITGDASIATQVAENNQMRSVVCNQDKTAGQADPLIDFAQSFDATETNPLAKISIYIKKVGNPVNRSIYIVADNLGSPDTTVLSEGILISGLVGIEYTWIDVVFENPAVLQNGSKYWMVLDARRDQNRYWIWCADSNQGYGNGESKSSSNWNFGSWAVETGDLSFRAFFGIGINSIDNVDVTGSVKANSILNSTIGGDAHYKFIDINSTVSGNEYPNSPDPSPVNLPISESIINKWKDDAGCGEQPAISPCDHAGDYTVSDDATIGPLTITGNLDMSAVNKTLTIAGTVYVEGNIDISNGSTIRCDGSFLDKSCIILTDGWIKVSNNGVFQGSGQAGSYIMLLSDLDCDGSSSAFPCDATAGNGAIDLRNNATGAIFYASDGLVNISNGVEVTEVTGYKIRLEQTATVSYEEGLISSSFSSGPGGSWNINTWKEVE